MAVSLAAVAACLGSGVLAEAGGKGRAAKPKVAECNPGPPTAELKVRLLAGNLPIVVGSVEGRAVNILIDTGASPAVLDAHLAKFLGLELLPGKLQILAGTISTPGVWIPDVEVGPVRRGKVPGLVRDLSYLKDRFGVSVGAIVGLDFLGDTDFRLDYESRTLTFGAIRAEGVAIPLDSDTPFAVANVEVRKKRLRLLVDTGASVVILFRERVDPYMEKLVMTKQSGVESLGGRVQAAGNTPWQSLEVTVDGTSHRAQNVLLVPNIGQFQEFDGLMAVHSLGFHALAYDQASRTLYLQ